jgi:hypothetical protein
VPELEEAGKKTTALTLRARMEEHRKNPACASCHAKMDPLGFGLENFDAVGAWRTMDGAVPVDASGTLPDGRTFTGPVELRKVLLSEREAFARAITGKLMTYALGRGLERSDRRDIKQMAKGLAAKQYRFSSLVQQIVESPAFQRRRAEPPAPPAADAAETRTAHLGRNAGDPPKQEPRR